MYKDFGHIFLRSPLYPLGHLFDGHGDTLSLDELLQDKLKDQVFMEALYWSSPVLYDQVVHLLDDGSLIEEKVKAVKQAVKKYIIRACSRTTPYGLLAGCSLKRMTRQAMTSTTGETPIGKRKARIDLGFLQGLIVRLETDPTVWTYFRYSVNNSVYKLGDTYRFLEKVFQADKWQYQTSSLQQTDILDEVLALSQKGPFALEELYTLIGDDVSYDEKLDFVQELIASQFFRSELQLSLTDSGEDLDRVEELIGQLAKGHGYGAAKYLPLFKSIRYILAQLDSLPLGQWPLAELKKLEDLANHLKIDVKGKHFFHVDLLLAGSEELHSFSGRQEKELNRAIRALGKLGGSFSPHEAQLKQFKRLFLEKYETREVPLTEALDEEYGIGYPAKESIGTVSYHPLLDNIGHVKSSANHSLGKTEKVHLFLQKRVESTSGTIIELKDEDLEGLEDRVADLADQIAVMGMQLPNGNLLLQSVGGAHANALLGRFAYLHPRINDLCHTIAQKEQGENSKHIFAEIAHMPEGRAANIVRRPTLTAYEIPYLATATGEQLEVSDLLLSVENDEVMLRSRKLGKRIIPRLSNAHNYVNSDLAIYRFLAAIQHQGKLGLEVSWGTWAQGKRFLPRLIYGNVILHRATWSLQEEDIRLIAKAGDKLIALRDYLQHWDVPRYICLTQGDNELFLDTLHDDYLSLMLEEIKHKRSVRLVEWLHEADYANLMCPIQQFVLPLERNIKKGFSQLGFSRETKGLQRTFAPGSEWVYFKLYCGAHLSDRVLLQVVQPVIRELMGTGRIERVFFIRYSDPHYHLRFRLLARDAGLVGSIMAYVHRALAPLVHSGTVWKVQLDTYQREIERYGEDAIEAIEQWFHHDSLLCLELLREEDFLENTDERFYAVLKNVDKCLALFALTLEERIDFCFGMSQAFAQEFAADTRLQLDKEYRKRAKELSTFMKSDRFEKQFAQRQKALTGLSLKMDNLASYIHMSVNRWFQAEQRLMEYMAYVFTFKYYKRLEHLDDGREC